MTTIKTGATLGNWHEKDQRPPGDRSLTAGIFDDALHPHSAHDGKFIPTGHHDENGQAGAKLEARPSGDVMSESQTSSWYEGSVRGAAENLDEQANDCGGGFGGDGDSGDCDEALARRDYLAETGPEMNQSLRTGQAPSWTDQTPEQLAAPMDAAFAKFGMKTPAPMTLFRGVKTQGEEQGFDPDNDPDYFDPATLSPGNALADPGFLSTTPTRGIAHGFSESDEGEGDGWTMAITVPKGQQFLPGQVEEDEMILPRGQVLKVTAVDPDAKTISLEVA